MFQDSLIVSSAASAFNNIAVVSPAFLWNAVLCLPLFLGVYIVGRRFASVIGLAPYVTRGRAIFWTVIMVMLWVILMGGNYDVLRDGHSLLPWVTAAILFVSSIFLGINTRVMALPFWFGRTDVSQRRRWIVNILCFAIAMVPVGLSDTLDWWGPILQIGVVVFGFLLGRYSGRQMRACPCAIGVMFAATIAILMQPEMFRFGQLGNLMPAHLVWLLLVGVLLAMAFAADVIKPCGRVHKSAYMKLKWLIRFVCVLCAVLFALTEAVPIFIATVFMAFVLVAMSIWHSETLPEGLSDWALAWAVIAFGVLVSVPTITVIGILLLSVKHVGGKFKDMKFLL